MIEVPGMRKVRVQSLVWKATRSDDDEMDLSTKIWRVEGIGPGSKKGETRELHSRVSQSLKHGDSLITHVLPFLDNQAKPVRPAQV